MPAPRQASARRLQWAAGVASSKFAPGCEPGRRNGVPLTQAWPWRVSPPCPAIPLPASSFFCASVDAAPPAHEPAPLPAREDAVGPGAVHFTGPSLTSTLPPSGELLHRDRICLVMLSLQLGALRFGCGLGLECPLHRPAGMAIEDVPFGRAVLSGVPPHVEQSPFYRCPQSSSASRFTAGAAGFLNLSQSGVRPER